METVSHFHEIFDLLGDKWARAAADLDCLYWGMRIEYLAKSIIKDAKLAVYIRCSKH